MKTHFDYLLVNGVAQVQYLGQAPEWTTDDDPRWTIKKFAWITAGDGSTQLDTIETLTGVAWSNRSSLAW